MTTKEILKEIKGDMYPKKLVSEKLIEFAKFHVSKALEEAAKNATTYGVDIWSKPIISEYSIINAYPLDEIK